LTGDKIEFDATADVSGGSSIVSAIRGILGPRMFHRSRALKGALLISFDRFKQDRRRWILFRDEVTDGAHFFLAAHGILYAN